MRLTKRFLLTEQFVTLKGVTFVKDDDDADVDTYYTVSGAVDLLNNLHEENEQLKSRVEYLERKIDRERTSYQKQHEKWEEEIQKENEQLKEALREELQDNGNAYYIETFDKLFNLNYEEWDRNERYRECTDWEKILKEKDGDDGI